MASWLKGKRWPTVLALTATVRPPVGEEQSLQNLPAEVALADQAIELTFPIRPSGPRMLSVSVKYRPALLRCEGLLGCRGAGDKLEPIVYLDRRLPVTFP